LIARYTSVCLLQITIHSASDEYPELRLTTFGTKEIFQDLREVCAPLLKMHPSGHTRAMVTSKVYSCRCGEI
jgi:hypothetical protein